MRKLLYVTLGLAASSALCAYTNWQAVFLPLLLSILLLTLATAAIGKNRTSFRKLALALLGAILGLLWFSQYYSHYLRIPAELDGQTQMVAIRVTDYSDSTDYGIAVDGMVTLEGKPYQIRAYLDQTEPLEPGQTVSGSFRFRVTTPDGADESTYYQGKGIFLLLYQKDEVTISKPNRGWQDVPAILRSRIKTILKTDLPEDVFPFAKALLLGDTSDLSYETNTDFKLCGIRHVVAVSGLHVSILFALISTLSLRKRWLTALLGFPCLLLFAAVAGFTPSVTRACVMSGLMLLAMLVGKEYDGATALSFAVLVMLLANPLVITSVSFQLSVASVAGIYLFQPGIQKHLTAYFGELKRGSGKALLVRWFVGNIATTMGAMIPTLPLCAYYFATISLVSPLTNLLTLWVISVVFYGLMAVCVLHVFWTAGAALAGKIVAFPVRYVLVVAETLADFPLSAVYTRSIYIVFWLIFGYLLLTVFYFSKNRKPATLFACITLGLCVALLASWAESLTNSTRFSVLNVGQGQCLLFQSQGKNYLIDCGGDSDSVAADTAAETLLSQGITKLDGLILTHNDRDHAGGVKNLLTRIKTDLLILPAEYSDLADHTDGEVIYAAENLQISWGNTNITIFAPTFPGNSNEMSLCLLLDAENCDILVTSDRSGFGERSLLRNFHIPDVDILVAGHHGSKNSTCAELLQSVRPEIVCISVGAGNSYGHPARELLQRLYSYDCTVYRTDIHGTITIRR